MEMVVEERKKNWEVALTGQDTVIASIFSQ